MRHDLHRRWVKLRRHLRTFGTSERALRDAARAMAVAPPLQECLCRPVHPLAA